MTTGMPSKSSSVELTQLINNHEDKSIKIIQTKEQRLKRENLKRKKKRTEHTNKKSK